MKMQRKPTNLAYQRERELFCDNDGGGREEF